MWTCRNCNAGFDFAQVEPEVDEQGFFSSVQHVTTETSSWTSAEMRTGTSSLSKSTASRPTSGKQP
jgi:hypothetical protein